MKERFVIEIYARMHS